MAFMEELLELAEIAPPELSAAAFDTVTELIKEDILSRTVVLLSVMSTIVVFQWPEVGINFWISLRVGVLSFQIIQFDRTRPAQDLVAPRIDAFNEKSVAFRALLSALSEHIVR